MDTNEITRIEQIIEEVKHIKYKLNSGKAITQEEAKLLTINDWTVENNNNSILSTKHLKY